jgi:hypothetical protein
VLGVPPNTEIQDLEPELAKFGRIASSKIGRVNQSNAWFSFFEIDHANKAHN